MGGIFRVQFRCGLERSAVGRARVLEDGLRQELPWFADVLQVAVTAGRGGAEFEFVLLVRAVDASAAVRTALARVSRVAREVCAGDPWVDCLVQSVAHAARWPVTA